MPLFSKARILYNNSGLVYFSDTGQTLDLSLPNSVSLTVNKSSRNEVTINSASNITSSGIDLSSAAPAPGIYAPNLSTILAQLNLDQLADAINSSAGVTSVNVFGGQGIDVAGNPVTTSGQFQVSLKNSGVVSGTYSNPTLSVDIMGRITTIQSSSDPIVSGTNIGNGSSVFVPTESNNLNFKTLVSGSGIQINDTGSELTISSLTSNFLPAKIINSTSYMCDSDDVGSILNITSPYDTNITLLSANIENGAVISFRKLSSTGVTYIFVNGTAIISLQTLSDFVKVQFDGVSWSVIEYNLGSVEDTFSSIGTFTWVNRPFAKIVKVEVYSPACGGGSGRRGQLGTSVYGGGGSAPGIKIEREFLASTLNPTEIIVVTDGGLGGASIMTDNTDGNSGQIPLPSSFGNWIKAFAPIINTNAGTSAAGLGTVANREYSNVGSYANGGSATLAQQTLLMGGIVGAGAAGGSISPSGLAFNGGQGGSGSLSSGEIVGGIGGLSQGGAGVSGTSSSINQDGGSGGGGGGPSLTSNIPGGTGGNGGNPGGGAGGGGASLNGIVSGRGGKGGQGKVIVRTIF